MLLVVYLWSYACFSVLVLREVRENSLYLTTFSLLLEEPNYKIPCSFHNLKLLMKGHLCLYFRYMSMVNGDMYNIEKVGAFNECHVH